MNQFCIVLEDPHYMHEQFLEPENDFFIERPRVNADSTLVFTPVSRHISDTAQIWSNVDEGRRRKSEVAEHMMS